MTLTSAPDDVDTLARLDAEVTERPAYQQLPPGAQALDEARTFYRRHFHFPSTVQADVFTIWTAGLTHMRDHDHRFVGSTAVRLYIRASTSGAGKSRLGDFIELTGGRGKVVFAPATTYWGLVQMISEENSTVVLDNFDEAKGAAKQGQVNVALAGAYDYTSLLRSGKADDPEAYVFGPLAITAIGDKLRRSTTFKPVEERSVVVDVAKKPREVKLSRFDRKDPEHRARTEAIRRACEAWGREVAPDYLTYRPTDLVDLDLDDRALEMWEPLVAIADLAGGEWPARIRRALRVLVLGESVEADGDDDPFARLTPAQRSMVDASHVLDRALDDARLAAIDAGAEDEDELPTSVPITTAELFERMAALPGGERWKIPQGSDRERIFKARTMALSSDLGMFGVTRSSVKVPANDGTGRFVNGWFSSDVLPCRPAELPHHRLADLESHARAVEEDDLPFD